MEDVWSLLDQLSASTFIYQNLWPCLEPFIRAAIIPAPNQVVLGFSHSLGKGHILMDYPI